MCAAFELVAVTPSPKLTVTTAALPSSVVTAGTVTVTVSPTTADDGVIMGFEVNTGGSSVMVIGKPSVAVPPTESVAVT